VCCIYKWKYLVEFVRQECHKANKVEVVYQAEHNQKKFIISFAGFCQKNNFQQKNVFFGCFPRMRGGIFLFLNEYLFALKI